MSDDVKRAFGLAMLDIYKRAKAETGYKPSIFHRMLSDHGGHETARRLIHVAKVSEGYVKLYELGRIDLTVEAVIIDNIKWHKLFTEDELKICRKRLNDYGYSV